MKETSSDSAAPPHRDAVHVFSLMAAKVIRAPLWLLISAMTARVLEPAGLGVWSMVLACATLLNQFFLLWTQSITQRYGRAEILSTGRLDQTWASRWPSLGTGLSVIALLLVLNPFDWIGRCYGLHQGLQWFVLPVVIGLWLMAESQGVQQVREHFIRLAWSPVVSDLVMMAVIAVLGVVKFGHGNLPLPLALMLMSGATLALWAVWTGIEFRRIQLSWLYPSRERWLQSARFAAPLVPGFLVGYLSEWCDYFLIRHFYPESMVGFFHPAYQYMLIFLGLPTAMAMVLLPKVLADTAPGSDRAVRQMVGRTIPQLFVLWGLVSLGVLALLPWVFGVLLGPSFAVSQELLRIVLIAVPGVVSSHLFGVAYFAQNRLGMSTVGLFGIKVLINALISWGLLPRVGIIGSAIGVAVSYVVLQWLFLLDQHRFLRMRLGTDALALALIQLSGIGMAMVTDTLLRLWLALACSLAILVWARQVSLFDSGEIRAMIPARLVGIVSRILTRHHGKL